MKFFQILLFVKTGGIECKYQLLVVLPLIGLTMPQLLLYEAILLPVILFHHSNIRIPSGLDRALRCIITTPWIHWVHHSNWQPETDSNFSSVLSIWDRLFGTFAEENRRPVYGLTKPVDTYNPLKLQYGEFRAAFADWRSARTWRDKLGFLFGPPGWEPNR